MRLLKELFDNNRRWAEAICQDDPEFFHRLVAQQSPELLWIGCADSRVPANQVAGLPPGAVFVHRNVANIVNPDDKNCLAVLAYAVDVLKIKHVLVVGHYRCGGVKAALDGETSGVVGEWLQPISALAERHRSILAAHTDPEQRWDRLCELNVVEQAISVARTSIVRDAWARGQSLAVHGWIYGVHNGLLRDLDVTITGPDEQPLAQGARSVEFLTSNFVKASS